MNHRASTNSPRTPEFRLQTGKRLLRLTLLLPIMLLAAVSFGAVIRPYGQEPQTPATPASPAPVAPAASPTVPEQAGQAGQASPAAPAAQAPEATVAAPAAPPQESAPAPAPPAQAAPQNASATTEEPGGVSEDELRRLLVGKPLYLRGGYLGDSLSFTEHGDPINHPPVGSYTISGVQIEKVRLTKHKVELEGARYALHFLGALPYEDPSKAVDRVKITPKKKVLKISIDREQVVKPKKVKEPREKARKLAAASGKSSAAAPAEAAEPAEPSEADQAKAELAATPEAERPADPTSVSTTTSPAHAAKLLRDALERIFSQGLDDQVRAGMPQFWQLYYKAQAAGVDYRPQDPNVLRSTAVEQQAKLLSSIAPDSNDYAQAAGVAGRALYRVVISADGKPGEIAVVRPIGFGLDENAVSAIRKATFQPALKGGQPVAETLDLAVLFRIYSKRTSVTAPEAERQPETAKPGPYTVRQPASNQ